MAETVFKRDLDTYRQRVIAYNLRTTKGIDDVSNEEVPSETQQIWGNKDWLASNLGN